MARFVALLRGINVGGNNIIKMSDLKAAFEKAGFTNVATYINSGNVLFESPETNQEELTTHIEKFLLKATKLPLRVVIRSHEQMKYTLANVATEWQNPKDFRCYLAFVKEPLTAAHVLKEIEQFKLKYEVDSVKTGPGVVYMITKMDGLTKSRFNKIAGTKIYNEITIRNYNTARKLLELMEVAK